MPTKKQNRDQPCESPTETSAVLSSVVLSPFQPNGPEQYSSFSCLVIKTYETPVPRLGKVAKAIIPKCGIIAMLSGYSSVHRTCKGPQKWNIYWSLINLAGCRSAGVWILRNSTAVVGSRRNALRKITVPNVGDNIKDATGVSPAERSIIVLLHREQSNVSKATKNTKARLEILTSVRSGQDSSVGVPQREYIKFSCSFSCVPGRIGLSYSSSARIHPTDHMSTAGPY